MNDCKTNLGFDIIAHLVRILIRIVCVFIMFGVHFLCYYVINFMIMDFVPHIITTLLSLAIGHLVVLLVLCFCVEAGWANFFDWIVSDIVTCVGGWHCLLYEYIEVPGWFGLAYLLICASIILAQVWAWCIALIRYKQKRIRDECLNKYGRG